MKIQDAANILSISGELTPQIVKAAYRKACSLYHPDRNPAGLEMMKSVNEAYETLKDYSGNIEKPSFNYAEALFEALQMATSLDGITIEICGAWVWLDGNTKAHKDTLRNSKKVLPNENGFRWAAKKKMWYFRPDDWKSTARGNWTMDNIRGTYGSQNVERPELKKIA